jgi:hypothetical protein
MNACYSFSIPCRNTLALAASKRYEEYGAYQRVNSEIVNNIIKLLSI